MNTPDHHRYWAGPRDHKGRPLTLRNGVAVLAHRATIEDAIDRPLNPGEYVHRACGEKECMNPDHLFVSQYFRRALALKEFHDRGGTQDITQKQPDDNTIIKAVPIGY